MHSSRLVPLRSTPTTAPSPILIAACIGLPQPRKTLSDLRRLLTSPCGCALIALVGWSLISTLWAPGGLDAGLRIVKVSVIMLAGILFIAAVGQMNAGERRAASGAIFVAVATMVVLVIVEFAAGGTPASDLKAAQSSRFVYLSDLLGTAAPVLAVLLWPALAILRLRSGVWLWSIAGAVLVGLAILLLPLASGIVAVVLGGAVFILCFARRAALAVVGAVFAVYVLAAPFLSAHAINLDTVGSTGQSMPTSWQHRLEIWRFTSEKALSRPLFGHGFDASREIGRASNPVVIWNPDGSGRNYVDNGLPLHPHNAALQVWLELGLVGIVVVICGVFATLAWIGRPGRLSLARATAAAGLTSFLVIELLSYGVWQSWWHAASWLMAGAVLVSVQIVNSTRPIVESLEAKP